ncbi:Plant transposon protein [Fragilaria crotonensis]|nr:Plant transposon protein [Fragilaria crotonensis]
MNARQIYSLTLLDQTIRNIISSKASGDNVSDADDIDLCYRDDGTLDIDRLEEFIERENDEDKARRQFLVAAMCFCTSNKVETRRALRKDITGIPRRARKSRMRRPKYFIDPSSGVLRKLTPRISLWWVLYIQNPEPNCTRWSKTFRTRFRLPYQSFLNILSMMVDEDVDGMFCRWTQNAGPRKTVVSPIELLLLGSLRYLGRGITFDDIEEATFISRHVHRDFMHRFVSFGAKVVFAKYVRMPTSLEEIRECEHAYRMAGFPGCIGSTDATHIPLDKVSFTIQQNHLGYKMSGTTRTYNLTVNHK